MKNVNFACIFSNAKLHCTNFKNSSWHTVVIRMLGSKQCAASQQNALIRIVLIDELPVCVCPYLVGVTAMENSSFVEFVKDPCSHADNTATDGYKDVVYKIEAHCYVDRWISVSTVMHPPEFHKTFVYTECPASGSTSQVRSHIQGA